MNPLKNTWFIIFGSLWLVIFICTKLHIYLWWPIQFYFIDLIAIPILGTLSLSFYRLILKDQTVLLPKWSIFFLFVGLSFVFEIYMPKHQTRYVADVWDIFMYAFGGLFFSFLMNKNLKN